MKNIDKAQDMLVEIAGTIVFVAGAWWLVQGNVQTGVGVVIAGLVLMGYKKFPKRMRSFSR